MYSLVAARQHRAVGEGDLDLGHISRAGIGRDGPAIPRGGAQKLRQTARRRGDVVLQVAYGPEPIAERAARAYFGLLDGFTAQRLDRVPPQLSDLSDGHAYTL